MTRSIHAILRTARSLTITPISYKLDADSRLDFEREMLSYNDTAGYSIMWDDSATNESRVNDLFAFIQGQGRKETDLAAEQMPGGVCQLHRVVAVFPHDHRPKGIWKIPEHAGRHVLILSDVLYRGMWVELCEATGREPWGKQLSDGTRVTSPRQGTIRWNL